MTGDDNDSPFIHSYDRDKSDTLWEKYKGEIITGLTLTAVFGGGYIGSKYDNVPDLTPDVALSYEKIGEYLEENVDPEQVETILEGGAEIGSTLSGSLG